MPRLICRFGVKYSAHISLFIPYRNEWIRAFPQESPGADSLHIQ